MTGAPGSRWSGFVNYALYSRPDVDLTDHTSEREYWKDGELMHRGSYFDPGMEFGNFSEEWDKPFSGNGYRVIKSHTFSFQLQYLTENPDVEEIWMIYRDDNECYDWWHEAGGWDITYPNYKNYYMNNMVMREQIALQNKHILEFVKKYELKPHYDNKRTIYRWKRNKGNG